jgi:imidazole glycerol-phosphate synthase subunit HisH
MIAIIDYGCGNILSLKRALDEIGLNNKVTSSKEEIQKSSCIILPGVGAFENAITLLKKKNLLDFIKKNVNQNKKPLIGICLGMQILFDKSYEMGEHIGLGLIDGEITKIKSDKLNAKIKVPHISWSKIFFNINDKFCKRIFSELNERSFYFIHSYFAIPKKKENIIAYCKYYDNEIPAIVKKNNVIGFQFHPEKSGKNGLRLLEFTLRNLIKEQKDL